MDRQQLRSRHAFALAVTLALGLGAPLTASALVPDLVVSALGAAGGDQLGFAVDGVGDFDGDGYDDLAVGAPLSDVGGADRGQVLVFRGGPDADDLPDLVLSGEAAGDQFGYAVRGAGDVNGDGYPDLLVGAPYNDAAGDNAGRAYVFFGGPAADAVADLVLTGEAAGDRFGFSVDGAGDLDGGGADLVVGAPYSAAGGSMAGRAYVFTGGVALDDSVDAVLDGVPGTLFGWCVARAGDLDADGDDEIAVGAILNRYAYVYFGDPAFDATPDLVLSGEAVDDRFGYAIVRAGDFNHDGFDDLLVGAIHNDTAAYDAGRAYLYYGSPSPDPIPDVKFTGEAYRDLFGRALAGPGDLNGDGIDDLVIGSPTPDTGGFGPGRAYVFLGGVAGSPRLPDNQPDLVLDGEYASDRFGCHINGAGDFDGDGRPEFVLGANLYGEGGLLRRGKFYVLGARNAPPLALADADTTLAGEPIALAVLLNDADSDGWLVPASLTITTPPAHGAATVDTLAGTIVYVPEAGFAGLDSLAYVVADDVGAFCAPVLVTVAVRDVTPPAPPTQLAAHPGYRHVTLSWLDPPDGFDVVEIWRAVWRGAGGGSAYPLYDGEGTVPPVRPASRDEAAAGGVWELAGAAAPGVQSFEDPVTERGIYYYELYAVDGAGNASPAGDRGARALNYLLGDLTDPDDGAVDSLDLGLLAGQLGLAAADSAFDAAYDIGPTDDSSPTGLPLTDGVVDFEDVMIAAMDYELSGPYQSPPPAAGTVQLDWRWLDERTLALHLAAPHPGLKGLRLTAPLPAGAVTGVAPGALLAAQGHPCFLVNVGAAGLDLSLVAMGPGAVLDGAGELCRISLADTLALSEPAAIARAADNTPLPTSIALVTDVPAVPAGGPELLPNWPNPFNPLTRLRFVLPARDRVRLAIYAVDGTRVRTLLAGELPAGAHETTWDGRDERGASAASGVYIYRLETSGGALSRRLTLLK